jgi:cell division protein FtsZ
MPKIEDFPQVAQKAMQEKGSDEPAPGIETQKKKVGFFERLTGRKSAKAEAEFVRDKEPQLKKQPVAGAKASPNPAGRHKASGEMPTRTQLSRAAGTPKPSGNMVSAHEENEDLEIPAFLKRQAN